MTTPTPPRWAEGLLRMMLAPRDRETVSGDLLEQYRDSVWPTRGQLRANLWYAGQVADFARRSHLGGALAISGLFVGRTALDWLVPTQDFALRAAASTYLSACVFLLAGVVASWRSRTIEAGIVAGAATAVMAAVLSVSCTGALLALAHGPDTMAAMAGSGGLEEAFILPIMLVVPGTVIGTVGAVAAALGRRAHAATGGTSTD